MLIGAEERLAFKSDRTAFFTICSKNYIHFARVWAKSVSQHHPGLDVYLFLADRSEGFIDAAAEPFDIVEAEELAIPDFESFSFRYDIMEFNTAIKPYCFSYLMARGYQNIIYMDPDTRIYAPLDDALEALARGATTVLTPHGLQPNENLEPPNDLTFLRSGVYNLGFMALRNTARVRELLAWWERRLVRYCVSDRLQDGLFVDQKWIDLWPGYCPKTLILDHPGYNVAYWNLDERRLQRRGDKITVNDRPLVFFHYSGLKSGDRKRLSKYQTRLALSAMDDAVDIWHRYHDELEENASHLVEHWRYAYGVFSNGTHIPAVARRQFREQLEPYRGDPFSSLPQTLNLAADIRPNPYGVVTLLSHCLWRTREDLKRIFHLRDGGSQVRYAQWFVASARREAGVPKCFIAPIEQRLAAAFSHPQAAFESRAPSLRRSIVSWMNRNALAAVQACSPLARPIYRHIDPERRRAFMVSLLRAAWSESAPEPSSSSASESAALGKLPYCEVGKGELREGLAVIGYPYGEFGIGEALRSLARSAEAASVPIDICNFDVHVKARQADRSVEHLVTNRLVRNVNVLCVNADMLGESMSIIGPEAFAGRFNIVRPFWELSRVNARWIPALECVDEIWAPTKFVRGAFADAVNRPVIHIPVAVAVEPPDHPDRGNFGLPPEKFLFLFSYDLASFSRRKNPGAVIEAFQKAFGADEDGVALVIKTMGEGGNYKGELAKLHKRVGNDKRVHFINGTLDRSRAVELMAVCDAFVSLHRAEGFGFGLAEAMSLAMPVIGTGYSGSSDFLSDQTGFPVGFNLVPVRELDYPHYQPGQVWADPDIEDAAKKMAAIFQDQRHARAVGQAARRYMQENHSPGAVGRVVRNRLRELGLLQDPEVAVDTQVGS